MTLSRGATLAVATRDQRSGDGLADLLRKQKITHATFTPTVLGTISAERAPHLQAMIVAGEAVSGGIWLLADWTLCALGFNAYGPTESTVCATMSSALQDDGPPPIGTPICNTRAYVLDRTPASAPRAPSASCISPAKDWHAAIGIVRRSPLSVSLPTPLRLNLASGCIAPATLPHGVTMATLYFMAARISSSRSEVCASSRARLRPLS